MRLWMLPLLTAALLAAASAAALGMPSLTGPTGIVTVPTSSVAPVDEWQTAVSYHSVKMYEVEELEYTVWSLQVLKGVADDAELWAAFRRVHNTKDTNIWELGGKYQLGADVFGRYGFLQDTEVAVGASIGRWIDAFGMYKIAPEVTDVDLWKAYLVATKQIMPAPSAGWEWETAPGTRVIGTLGLLYMRVDPDIGESETLFRPFLGLEIIGRNNLTLALEYRLKEGDLEDDEVFSAALRRQFGEYVALELGTTNASPIGLGTGDQEIFVRLGYDIPLITGY